MAGYFPAVPHTAIRNDFCRLYLIIEYRPVLMMYGFEYALRPDVITVAEFGVAARKIVSRVITRPS
jgi:hypothetical protein